MKIILSMNPTLAATTTSVRDSGIVRGLNETLSFAGGLSNILIFGLGIGAALALGTIIYAGVLWSTSGDNPSKQKEAREWIWAAVKGLGLIAFGYTMFFFLNPDIMDIKEIKLVDIEVLEENHTVFPIIIPISEEEEAYLLTNLNKSPLISGSPASSSKGSALSVFGERFHPILEYCRPHNGIDFNAGRNDPVYAIADGKVSNSSATGGYGNLLIIDHANGYSSYYAHLNSFMVKSGDIVRSSQFVAKIGSTGLSTGDHLHFEIRKNGIPIDINSLFGVNYPRTQREIRCSGK